MSKQEVKFESKMSAERAITYLEELVQRLRSGTIYLEHGADNVTLHIADQVVELELEATRKHDKEKLCVELCWRRMSDDGAGALRIAPAE